MVELEKVFQHVKAIDNCLVEGNGDEQKDILGANDNRKSRLVENISGK